MADYPALPLFTDAYLADTRHLSTEEHGAYLLLLFCAWRSKGCSLSDDDRALARIVGLSPTRWRKMRPVMLDFFEIKEGRWFQKRLSKTHETVAAKVLKNRLNGAKGGAAKARNQAGTRAPANARATGKAKPVATKTKAKTKNKGKEEALRDAHLFDMPDAHVRIAAAAGLDAYLLDFSVVHAWLESRLEPARGDGEGAAAADLDKDILPTIQRIRAREIEKRGEAPTHLAYYTAAIMEARDVRLMGLPPVGDRKKEGEAQKAVPTERRAFDTMSDADWRAFLGDPASRFAGDHIGRHWYIPADHPVFDDTPLGPNPKFSENPKIPAAIYQTYGTRWGWYRAKEMSDSPE